MSTEPPESSTPRATPRSVAAVVQPSSDNPYQSPNAQPARERGPGGVNVVGDAIKPVRWAGIVSIVGLSCSVCLAAFSIYMTLDINWLLLASSDQAFVAPSTSTGDGRLAGLVNALEQSVVIMTAIPFLIWFHRCYRNLACLHVEGTRYSTRWAVGGWFIPFLNVVRPYQVAREIWDASNPDFQADEGPRGWQMKRSGRLVLIWWVLVLAPGVVFFVSNRFFMQPESAMLKVGVWLNIGGNLVNGAAAVALILVIRRLGARQAARQSCLRAIFASHRLAHLVPAEVDPSASETSADNHDERVNERP